MTKEQFDRLGVIENRLNALLPRPWIRIWPSNMEASPSEKIDDILQALEAYLDGRYHPLPKFGDSVRSEFCTVNPAPDAAAPAAPTGTMGFITVVR